MATGYEQVGDVMMKAQAVRTPARLKQLLVAFLALSAPGCSQAQSSGDVASLVLERTAVLPNVTGRIDHLAADARQNRAFIAELGNGSVDVVDLKSGQSRRIVGLKSPQGLGYVEDRDELVVASGGDGSVRYFDGKTLAQTALLYLGSDADDVRIDSDTGQAIVGYGSGALAIIDPVRRTVVRTIPLPAHPEGFSIDPSTHRAYVNVPDDRSIIAVDLGSGTQIARWPAAHLMNFPMALDGVSKTLAIVYRLPARHVLLDEERGTVKQDLPTCGDADDVYFDAQRHRIYVSCGSGAIDVFQKAATGYSHLASIATQHGAGTSLFLPDRDRLLVAARAPRSKVDAALMVFRPGP